MKNKIIYLLGYKSGHTHTYPQLRFNEVLSFLGEDVRWVNIEEVDPNTSNRIFICWDQPNANELVEKGIYKKGDIILQKVTALVSQKIWIKFVICITILRTILVKKIMKMDLSSI